MKNKKWNKFDKLVEKCYLNMIGAEKEGDCWQQAFELLMEIVREERQSNSQYAPELELLEEATDYEYDIQGWLEDCLDEIDMRSNYELLSKMCDELLELFGWPEYTGSDIKFRKAAVLGALGKRREAVDFCKKWILKEPENIIAAAAGVYSFIEVKEYEEAEQLVDRFIFDKSQCSAENDIMFTAASKLYATEGKRKEKKLVDKAMKEYEKCLKEYFESSGFEDEDDEFSDWDLPF